jgi:NADPH:quinone reductase-like Zn-dependent oxidoreductase
MTTMKAVRIHTYGGPEVLAYEDAPRPVAGEREVLIRVHATTVNPFGCAVHAGYMGSYLKHTLPLILGTDVSGVVEEIGPGVTDLSKGDEVYTRAGVFRDGANAEYVVASAADVAAKPPSLDHLQAAALPHVSLTAWQALIEMAQLREGQTVLIHGAAGGVGHIAAQLAHWRGARVIGTASANLDLLPELHVEEAIDYGKTRFESVVHGVDVVLDTVGGDVQQRSYEVLKPGGWLLSTVQAPSEETAKAKGVHAQLVASSPPIRATLDKVAGLVASGKVRPVVSTVLPLAGIRKAHEMIEGRHTRGKIVLKVAA